MAKTKETKPVVTETPHSYDVAYGKELTVVVSKEDAKDEAHAIKLSQPAYKEFISNQKKQEA